MPKVTKQSPPPTVNHRRMNTIPSSSVLDRIASIEQDEDGIKLCCYGRGKTGKTRLACSFPKPLLLIGTEKGTKSIAGIQDVKFVRIQASEEVAVIAAHQRETVQYQTLVLDTAGGLQDLIVKEVLGLDEIPVQRSWGMAQQRDWGIIGQQTKERLRCLLDLSEAIGTHVVIIAHERNFNEGEGNSDVMLPSVGAALSPSTAGWLNAACDYVCQAYIRQKEVIKETKVGDKIVKTKQPAGGAEYCLRVGPHPVFLTGFRLPVGRVLPESIVDPNYVKIAQLIKG